jgi:Family of unknown function (DUF5681)
MSDDSPHDDVGYGKPPEHTRFRKGVSGNPRGRPKGTRNFGTVFNSALQEKVGINENGKRRTITKFAAACKQLVNKAASGDLQAMRQLTQLLGLAEDGNIAAKSKADLSESDKKIMAGLLERMQKSTKENNHDNDD